MWARLLVHQATSDSWMYLAPDCRRHRASTVRSIVSTLVPLGILLCPAWPHNDLPPNTQEYARIQSRRESAGHTTPGRQSPRSPDLGGVASRFTPARRGSPRRRIRGHRHLKLAVARCAGHGDAHRELHIPMSPPSDNGQSTHGGNPKLRRRRWGQAGRGRTSRPRPPRPSPLKVRQESNPGGGVGCFCRASRAG
jgi:hypothetical protein